jgi:hypothetical protein
MSPSTRQPSAGWQIWTPVGAYTSHSRLQHPPQSLHSEPSTPVQFVPPTLGCEHVPSVAPEPIVQMPPQHSASCAHASPFCVQYDDGPQ